MKQSTPFAQKLAGYSALAAALTGFASSADAQITYSGDKTTTIASKQSATFDLDGDGINDITITQKHKDPYYTFSQSNDWGAIKAETPNIEWLRLTYGCRVAPLTAGNDIIADSRAFGANASATISYFKGASEKFMGVKFLGGTTNYIGWIRINVGTSSASITVKDWAYMPITGPSTTIKAGDKGNATTISTLQLPTTTFNIYPTITKENITIESENAATYQLIDITGVVINEGTVEVGKNTINTSTLKKGIYLVKIINESGSAVKRIVKE